MATKKAVSNKKEKVELWIKIIPIIVGIIALFFTIYQYAAKPSATPPTAINTWEADKVTFNKVIELVSSISAAQYNDSILQALKPEFDRYFNASIKISDDSDSSPSPMLVFKRDYEQRLRYKTTDYDYHQPNRLDQSCKDLVSAIKRKIAMGDLNFK